MIKVSDAGVLYDVFYIVEKYLKEGEITDLVELNEVPEVIKLFFYKGIGGKTLIQQISDEKIADLLDKKVLEKIAEALSDNRLIADKVLGFYFAKEKVEYGVDDYQFVRTINKLIFKSSYPLDIKNSLYCFFIEPETVLNEVIKVLKQLHHQVALIHNDYAETALKIQQNLNTDALLKKLDITNCSDKIILAPCIINNEYFSVVNNKNAIVLILGEEYEKSFEKSGEDILNDFASIFSEVNRIRILNSLHKNNEMIISEITNTLNLTATNVYYHLTLMLNAGIIKKRNKGRTIIYSLNKSSIMKVCEELSKYCDE